MSDETRFQAVFARRSLIVLVVLLLGETSINYIDRQVVSVLAPTLRAEFHLSNGQYAAVLNAFM
ncbi:MAG: MFS transporter, partial [Bryobacteraceae bacterium]